MMNESKNSGGNLNQVRELIREIEEILLFYDS